MNKQNAAGIGFLILGLFAAFLSIWLAWNSAQIRPQPSLPGLEEQLSSLNINLSSKSPETVRGYLASDQAYCTISLNILRLLQGRKLIGNPVPLDEINGKYKALFGVDDKGYLPPEQYDDIEKVKAAILEAWKDHNLNNAGMTFDQILTARPQN